MHWNLSLVWQCNRHYEKKGEVRCGNKHVNEEILFKVFGEEKVVVNFLDGIEVECVVEYRNDIRPVGMRVVILTGYLNLEHLFHLLFVK